jgi:alpha-ketoglutarate-dependent taurine dioxygenase
MSDLARRIAELSPAQRAVLEARLLRTSRAAQSQHDLARRRPQDPLLPSFSQQRLWFLERLTPHTPTYNVADAMRLRGPLDVPALRQALEAVIGRHEVLRTTFAERDGLPVPVVAPRWSFELPVRDLTDVSEPERAAAGRDLLEAEAGRPFDLARDLMLRALLVRLGPDEHLLLLTVHHIAFDAWSRTVLYRELAALYAAFVAGRPSGLPELPLQYTDFALWQRRWLQEVGDDRTAAYWMERLAGAARTLDLPTDHPRPAVQTFQGARHMFALPEALVEATRALSRQQGSTVFAILLAAFAAFLHRWTGQRSVGVGSPVAGRDRTQLEGLIGFFVNTVVLHVEVTPDATFRQLLDQTREVVRGAYAHSRLPFEKLVELLKPPRDLGRMPLVQVNFRVIERAARVELPGLTVTPLPSVGVSSSRFDLALQLATDPGPGEKSYWEYSTTLFDPETIAWICTSFQGLLGALLARPDTPLGAFEMAARGSGPRHDDAGIATRLAPAPPGLREVRRKAVPLAPADQVEAGALAGGGTLPLLLRPTVAEVDLADWARRHPDAIRGRLGEHGAVLFRGFGLASPSAFEAVATAICSELFGEYGDLPREAVTGKIYGSTPYPADRAILFHNESSHLMRWPRTIAFFCVQAPSEGGATPLVDCRDVYRRLRPEIRERFERLGLMYVRNFAEGLDVSWREFFRTDDRRVVEQICAESGMRCEWTARDALRVRTVCPAVARHPRTGDRVFFNQLQLHHPSCLEPAVRDALRALFAEEDLPRHVYYGDGSPIEDEVVWHVREVYDRIAVRYAWEPGDMLVVDNMLTAHGRDPYRGARKIVVAMGDMIGRDEF